MEKTAFLFSGQGAQYPGMMKDFYENYGEVRAIFEKANEILERDISRICFNGPEEELILTHNTQPCMLTAEVSVFEVLKAKGIMPDAVAGFSLGEYSALVAADVMSFEDAIKIVQIRADVMQEAVPAGEGGMAAIKKATPEKVRELCESCKNGYIEEANFNSPGQIVVSGEIAAVKELVDKALSQSIVALELPVSAPFHCKLMEPAANKLKRALAEIEFQDASVPVYLNVDAKVEVNGATIKDKLVLQAKSPVLWNQLVSRMYDDGMRAFIEVGPGNTLLKFGKKILKGKAEVKILNIERKEDLKKVIG